VTSLSDIQPIQPGLQENPPEQAQSQQPTQAPPIITTSAQQPATSGARIEPNQTLSAPVLEFYEVSKVYGKPRVNTKATAFSQPNTADSIYREGALSSINFRLPPNRIIGLIGPNGSGKTTLIKLAAGLLEPTYGNIKICGFEPGENSKALVSYLPERPYFARSLTVREQVEFFQKFYADFDIELARRMLTDLHIDEKSIIASLSKGTVEKVQLILVMARRARLYLLDEPIGGVDPATRDYVLRTIVEARAQNSTVVVSTHLVADVEPVLDDYMLIRYGRLFDFAPISHVAELGHESLDAYFRSEFRC
jgi:ABC-2 type transport system ATP-binding protein